MSINESREQVQTTWPSYFVELQNQNENGAIQYLEPSSTDPGPLYYLGLAADCYTETQLDSTSMNTDVGGRATQAREQATPG